MTCQRERTESGGERVSAQGREIRMRATRFAVKLIAGPAFVCACVRVCVGWREKRGFDSANNYRANQRLRKYNHIIMHT